MIISHRLVIPLLLIPLLSLFTYQAIKSSIAAVQLTKTRYLLQQNTRYGLTEKQFIIKTQKALNRVKNLTADDPIYHKLSANLMLWQESLMPDYPAQNKMHNQAKQHYLKALQDQPANPHLWYRLAQADRSNPKKEYSINAIIQAGNYAPSDKVLLLNILLWKIPVWQQLSPLQQKETINQLKQFTLAKWSGHKNKQKIKQSLKKSGQRINICSKLPRTKEIKMICY